MFGYVCVCVAQLQNVIVTILITAFTREESLSVGQYPYKRYNNIIKFQPKNTFLINKLAF